MRNSSFLVLIFFFLSASGQKGRFDIYDFYKLIVKEEASMLSGNHFICDSLSTAYSELERSYTNFNSVDLLSGIPIQISIDSLVKVYGIKIGVVKQSDFERMIPYDTSVIFTKREIRSNDSLSNLEQKWLKGEIESIKYQQMVNTIYSSPDYQSYAVKLAAVKKTMLVLFKPLKFTHKVLIMYKWYNSVRLADSEVIKYLLFSLDGKCLEKR